MIVPVLGVALDGDEEIAGLKRPAVDRDAFDRCAQPHGRRGAERGREFSLAPERGHAASLAAARASSASENGSVRAPTIWPVS